VKVDGAVIYLWEEREVVNERVRLFHMVENLGFVILQKDLLVYQIKTLTLELAKN
jgi:hypothetical protein